MRVLLLSGLGPGNLNLGYLTGSLFDPAPSEHRTRMLERAGMSDLDLGRLSFALSGRSYGLLRPRPASVPHLTTLTLNSILESTGQEFERVDLELVWSGDAEVPAGDFDAALLSTTFIWNPPLLAAAIGWITSRLPGVPIVAGGQYTNLKYVRAMHDHPSITAVVRGDAESALPMTLKALADGGDLAGVPNVVWRDGDRMRINPIEYVDIDAFPSPSVRGEAQIVPYESMRGCPFDCKFCSFPAASPKWRYKSAEKIRDDWMSYASDNGARMISAMDSTFTIPPTRLRRLMEILPESDVPPWEGFSRANTINSTELVDKLAASNCRQLHIGFESMNDDTLKLMSKRVTAKQNRKAGELLSRSALGYYILFIVGYPGEDPDMFRDTQDYLVNEHVGHFALSKFSITDENMPLWEDREKLQIVAENPNDTTAPWSHIGMDSDEALRLQLETFDKVRKHSETAVLNLWQHGYQHTLLPRHDRAKNIATEKCVDRLAMAPKDYPDVDEGAHAMRTQVNRLRDLGVTLAPTDRDLCLDVL